MTQVAIKAENISKAYQLGEFSTGTISRDIERWWARMRGKEDPFLKLGETNDRANKGTSDIVWSLKDINFEINKGDAVGIIGRNGAGKSTLLKVLSRVTTPTQGSVKVKGRIASLLEVGTGFHPELTGRENIFLNGAILGMRKAEIRKHFDAIVDFAGVERYIDTPVKRYSSGMYVRLAFAVAAHLESEILIVDEVLAVGDAEFQSKCLGKMGQVSSEDGRTVLFVSHNMGAINQLCKKGILLKHGMVEFEGRADQAVNEYLKKGTNAIVDPGLQIGPLAKDVLFNKITINNEPGGDLNFEPGEALNIHLGGECISTVPAFRFSLSLFKDGIKIFTTHNKPEPDTLEKGDFKLNFTIPPYLLRPGHYLLSVGGHTAGFANSSSEWMYLEDISSFNIIEKWDAFNDFNSSGLINLSNT